MSNVGTPKGLRCALCGATQAWQPIEHLDQQQTNLYHCGRCDGQFWWPVLNPGADWYEATYAARNDDPVQNLGWNHRQFLDEPIPPGTMLDVGCGIGHLMAAAQGRGWQVWGLDFDEDAARTAREHFGIATIATQSMEEYARANPGKQFTAVTAFEVLEHMDDPASFIRDMRALVAPGGYVAISVPYRRTPFWLRPKDLPPRHMTRWSRTSLANFLVAHGFNVRHVRRGSVSLEWILIRLRFKAGPLGHMNVVARARAKLSGSRGGLTPAGSKAIALLRRGARLKDWILLGLPTLACWLYLWVTRRHYFGLYALAQKPPEG